MNGTEEPVGDEGVEKRLRSQAHWTYVESAIAALILTVLSFFFASVLSEAARSSEGLSLEQAALPDQARLRSAVWVGAARTDGFANPGCSSVNCGRRADSCRQDEFDVRGSLGIHRGYFG